jgi:hypothetical protein
VPLTEYDFVLADPPYGAGDAERYGRAMVDRHRMLATLNAGLPSGAFVVWLDHAHPMYRKAVLRPEAVIGVVGSTNHRFRLLTVFRKV